MQNDTDSKNPLSLRKAGFCSPQNEQANAQAMPLLTYQREVFFLRLTRRRELCFVGVACLAPPLINWHDPKIAVQALQAYEHGLILEACFGLNGEESARINAVPSIDTVRADFGRAVPAIGERGRCPGCLDDER